MDKYNPKTIEPKWQKRWKESGIYSAADVAEGKENHMLLTEFPYPSGNLHIGHWYAFAVPDILARYLRLKGKNVMYPMGFDAFGLPAENAAIKRGLNPRDWTEDNIRHMTEQFQTMGGSFDWSRKVSTIDPEYYRWTQWIFLKMFEKGLAYRKEVTVNWCPSCKTVLANEQVAEGLCERCDAEVVQKKLEQWLYRITDYADRLIDDIEGLDWPESTKLAQKNWIGRSEGAIIKFEIQTKAQTSSEHVEVFTTRLDTIFGCTYCVVAPEHEILKDRKLKIENREEVEQYITDARKKTELQRTMIAEAPTLRQQDSSKVGVPTAERVGKKTGVELKGIKAINPFTNEEVPVFVADYVLATYGTGAVMAVPAHDERDFEFAKKYGLPIKQVITPDLEHYNRTKIVLESLKELFEAAEEKKVQFWLVGGLAAAFYVGVIYREHSDLDLIAKDEKSQEEMIKIFEELGFHKVREKKLTDKLTNHIYKNKLGIEIDIGPILWEFGLKEKDFETSVKKLDGFESLILDKKFIKSFKEYQLKNRNEEKDRLDFEYLNGRVLTDDGVLVNSGEYSGLTSAEAREKMAAWLEKNGFGKKEKKFRLHDWVISRQRYWGVPIPVVYCEHCAKNFPKAHPSDKGSTFPFPDFSSGNSSRSNLCAIIPVPEKDLPIELPELKDFLPTGDGKSPLAKAEEWARVKCPECGGDAKRETDTMDTFVDSSWYFIRYADPHNKNKFADEEKMKQWLPVPMYIGGAEHNTMHLLYSRFFTKVLFDLGLVGFSEPFTARRNHGIILGPDNQKMSKSRGNVIDPDAEVKKFGADAVRMYLAFMGPYDQNASWQMQGVTGTRRFLERIFEHLRRLENDKDWFKSWCDIEKWKKDTAKSDTSENIKVLLNKTIKKVSEDIEDMRFNTAISAMMIFLNELYKTDASNQFPDAVEWESSLSTFIREDDYEKFIIILSPFAPHIAEELWEKLGHKTSIFAEKWPEYDPKLVKDEEIMLIVQVNGKMRDQIKVPAGVKEEDAKQLALESAKVIKYVEGREVRKVIFVKDRLINFVITD